MDWLDCEKYLNFDESVKQVSWAKPGFIHAITRFNEFTSSSTEGLKNFDTLRNDPNYEKVCSNLSPCKSVIVHISCIIFVVWFTTSSNILSIAKKNPRYQLRPCLISPFGIGSESVKEVSQRHCFFHGGGNCPT